MSWGQGDVRRLRLSDLDVEARRVRIEQSKGLKDRVVYLSAEAGEALQAYLAVRAPATSDHVFLYRHRPLSCTCCGKRLRTWRACCGVRVTPHQLRCSFATLLLNAGASVLTVQALLGHKHVDTTLRYARVYDSTVAADYARAVRITEQCIGLPQGAAILPPRVEQRQDRHPAAAAPDQSSSVGASMPGQMLFRCGALPSRFA